MTFVPTSLTASPKTRRPALSPAETAYFYTRIRELSAICGLRFSTCYIGNDATRESLQRYRLSVE